MLHVFLKGSLKCDIGANSVSEYTTTAFPQGFFTKNVCTAGYPLLPFSGFYMASIVISAPWTGTMRTDVQSCVTFTRSYFKVSTAKLFAVQLLHTKADRYI